VAEWLKAHAWKACIRETVSWVRIPPSPPRINYLTLWLVWFFGRCEFFRRSRGLCANPVTTDFVRRRIPAHLPRARHVCLVSAIRWYGGLRPNTRIHGGRVRRETRDRWGYLLAHTTQTSGANPRTCRCWFQSSGNRVSSIKWRAVSSGGCLPQRIALTMSGANIVRRKSRVT
jgi:hypothetical protein